MTKQHSGLIRALTREDAPALQPALWPTTAPDSTAGMLMRAQKMAEAGRGDTAVMVIDGRLCGYAQLTLWPRSAEISDLIVTPGLRGHGIGTALILYLLGRATVLGAVYAEIGATRANTGAIRLYERLGFRIVREMMMNVGNGAEPVVYLSRPVHLETAVIEKPSITLVE